MQCWQISGGGFHFGRHGLGQEASAIRMSSDSLFAALLARLAEVQGSLAVEAFMAPFLADEPPFVLTSTFPFAGGVRFFPVPAAALQADQETHSATPKELKRVIFLSEALFRRCLAGETLVKLYSQAQKLQEGIVLASPQEVKELPPMLRKPGAALWRLEKRPRVTLGRAAENSTIYFTGRVEYAPECGLWFGVRRLSDKKDLDDLLRSLFSDLGDAGLGAERSVGFGVCRFEQSGECELPDAAGNRWTNLSRYLPRPEELPALQHSQAAYHLENVAGWLDLPVRRGQRRRAIHLVAEGATLGPLERLAPGMVVDVRPSYPSDPDPLEHPVYRCGLTVAAGLEGETR